MGSGPREERTKKKGACYAAVRGLLEGEGLELDEEWRREGAMTSALVSSEGVRRSWGGGWSVELEEEEEARKCAKGMLWGGGGSGWWWWWGWWWWALETGRGLSGSARWGCAAAACPPSALLLLLPPTTCTVPPRPRLPVFRCCPLRRDGLLLPPDFEVPTTSDDVEPLI
jgi:hypothetical protein